MTKHNNLQIVFCGNDKMFTGLYLLIQSILRRTKSTIDFYLLTGNLTKIKRKYKKFSKQHDLIISNLVKSFNKKNSFKLIDCGSRYCQKMSNAKLDMRRWTPYTLFRLFIEELNFERSVLYLDIDMLVAGDIKQAFDVNMSKTELCVCQDLDKEDWNNGKYFNAGALLINADYCKKTHLFNKAFKYCVEKNPEQLDQSALNSCWISIKFWKNQYRFNCQPGKKVKNAVIYHFYSGVKIPRPWKIKKFSKWLAKQNIHTWNEDYKLYNEAKRNFNKYK